MSDKTAQELAEEVSKPGKFSFVDRLLGRNYPTDDVTVYLDEKLGYKLLHLEEQMNAEKNVAALKGLEREAAEVSKELAASRYVVHMQSISNEDWDKLVEFAAEQFPYEYEEIVNPFSGAKSKQIIDSDDRTEYFTKLLWEKFIVSIEDNDGNVDDDVSFATVDAFRKQAPFSAISRVSETISKLRMATDWVEYIQDEDFLAKP